MQGWASDEPLVIERAEGNYLFDDVGRRYLDGVSSLWCNVHGHRKREIDDAIRAQLDRVAHSTLLGLASVPSIELAEALVRLAPAGLTRVFYSDSGSTAVEVALKMAYQCWRQRGRPEKARFAALSEAYHGDTVGTVSVGGMELFQGIVPRAALRRRAHPHALCLPLGGAGATAERPAWLPRSASSRRRERSLRRSSSSPSSKAQPGC